MTRRLPLVLLLVAAPVAAEEVPSPIAAYGGGGIAVLVNNDVQLDLFFQHGLDHAAADWIYGLGVSARFARTR